MVKDLVIEILEKYEDNIMENILGNSLIEENGERYVDIYRYEWNNAKEDLAYTISMLFDYGDNINSIGMAYMIISECSDFMTFDSNDLNINNLQKLSENILTDLVVQTFKM